MERLNLPWLFLGPSGSGKLSQARAWIEAAHKTKLTVPLEMKQFTVGDGYEARVFASPFHFEIDIPNLSMQDKQIIGELLTTFFSSGDVLNGLRTSSRKLVILRRAHSLSLPAAIRVRAVLQQFVLPPDARGMIWMTAREMTGPLALLEDAFVRQRVPRMPYATWASLPECPALLRTEEAWEKLEGRPERIKDLCVFFPDGNVPAWPRRIQDFYDELLQLLIQEASSGKPPTLRIISWIRGRVYQALSMCQTGPEIIDSCAAAIQRHVGLLASPDLFWKSMRALTMTEPHTSYRTPLSLEAGLLGLFEAIRQATPRKAEPLVNELRGGMESPSKKRGGAAAAKAPKPEIVEHAAAAATATATATGTAASVDTVVQSLLSKRAPARKKSSKA
jgi:hypothetical protein